jgi:3-hydroxy-3-methylglutaryl CoA synthase/NAD(P)-dependent dehydrogenase (short-subunit alcohol dehydrogenase family)/putative sterol carrier protein
MAIYQALGWLYPALVMVAQGERSFCNHDEDSLTLAVTAAQDCLTGMDKSMVKGIYLCSTTLPFADRQNAAIGATALNLASSLTAADFTSCQRAGTTGLLTALTALAAGQASTTLVIAADKRDAKPGSFYEQWFGDGAASLLVGREGVIAEFVGAHSVTYDFVEHYRGAGQRFDYTWEERWAREEGYGKIIPQAVRELLSKLGLTMKDVHKLIFPCIFKAEHRAIAKALGASPDQLADNMHEILGETGTAHPLIMFIRALEEAKPGDGLLLAGFGQGCDALFFRVTENIRKLPARLGVKGFLDQGKSTDNYLKFLKFRGLLETERGIRAEAPTQTAMTALWRKRKMILGLVGGRCRECGTAQYPLMDICVNPACGAMHSQEEYEFAHRRGTVKTFTGDMLAVSDDPPAIYGMVQFEGGGRFMADFTDCELEEIKVGMPVKMYFRRRFVDDERGFSGYFWKAVPQPQPQVEAEIRFDGQVALITGAGGGLGREYALELARRGAKVVVNDFGGSRDGAQSGSAAPADAVVGEIIALGGCAIANYDNVASPEGGERMVQMALDHFGRLDILICNAGILRDKSFGKMSQEDWRQVLAVHLDGAYLVCRPAVKVMREAGYGRIILTTSASGLFGNFGQTNYGAAKAGLLGFMNTLKLEGRKYNILVNIVAPLAGSRLTEDVLPPELFKKLAPQFVVPLVVMFASSQCRESGLVINSAGGYFCRTTLATGSGVSLGNAQNPPTVEDIRDNWEKINVLAPGHEYPEAGAAVMALASPPAPPVAPAAASPSPGGPDVAAVFRKLPEVFCAEAARGKELVFQFHITGEGGGDWSVAVDAKGCRVSSGTVPKATTTIRMEAGDFLELIQGRLDGMKAFSSGRLKIDGDVMKAQLIGKLFPLKGK